MTKKIFYLIMAAALLAVAACDVKPPMHKAERAEKEEGTVVSREEVYAKLPCFGCHSIEKVLGEPKKGEFPHTLHMSFAKHCNQCHVVTGHNPPRLVLETCAECHQTKALTYSGGGMGKVNFNHIFHASSFGCRECHPEPFRMKKGADKIKMDPMYKGKSCGKCHDGKMAFSAQDCTKCHKG